MLLSQAVEVISVGVTGAARKVEAVPPETGTADKQWIDGRMANLLHGDTPGDRKEFFEAEVFLGPVIPTEAAGKFPVQ